MECILIYNISYKNKMADKTKCKMATTTTLGTFFRADLIEVFKIIRVVQNVDPNCLFQVSKLQVTQNLHVHECSGRNLD